MRAVTKHVFSRQFLHYFCAGVGANVIDIGLFYLLSYSGMWYIHAQIIGGASGFLSAFLFHRYLVFEGQSAAMNHFMRFCVLGAFNIMAVTGILYLLVDVVGISEAFAKIPANASVVLWNFFIYKFLVYV